MQIPSKSMFSGGAQPAFDQIDPQRRLDFGAPMLVGTIGGRPVVLARPDQRTARPDEPFDVTVPLTRGRFRRAIDIERDRATTPYVPSPLAGHYVPGMTYSQAQVVAATLTAPERTAMLQGAINAMPSCYSQAFHDCVKGQPGAKSFPGCSAVSEGYVADWDAMEKLVDELPYCSEPIKIPYLAACGAAAIALGVGLGMLLRR